MTEIIEMYSSGRHSSDSRLLSIKLTLEGLYTVTSIHSVNQATGAANFETYRGFLRVMHFDSASMCVNALQSRNINASAIDPILLSGDVDGGENLVDLYILDSEDEDLGSKMDSYLRQVAPKFFETEKSNFMKITLEVALQLSRETEDALLTRALELWTATQLNADPERDWLVICEEPAPSSPDQPLMRDRPPPHQSMTTPRRTKITMESSPLTYQLITVQLASAAEKRCNQHLKSVIHDLENRLLQRREKTSFSSFLTTIIMLNAAERMSWFLKSREDSTSAYFPERVPEHFDLDSPDNGSRSKEPPEETDLRKRLELALDRPISVHGGPRANMPVDRTPAHGDTGAQYPNPSQHALHIASIESPTSPQHPSSPPRWYRKQRTWPLEKSPSVLINQNQRFTELLFIIASKRGIIPKFVYTADGYLDIAPETRPVKRSRSPRSVSPGPQDVSREWVSAIRMRRDELEGLVEGGERLRRWDEKDVRSCDFSLMGRFLVPREEKK